MTDILTIQGYMVDFEAAVALMDDDLCEQLNQDPDTELGNEQAFYDRYAAAHFAKFGKEFVVA
jgi:hypothetical protein